MLNDLSGWKKIKAGDIKAFEKVFRFYYSSLCMYALGITGNKEVAEEIIQDVFYTLWKERETLSVTHSFKSYLYSSVRNRSLSYCEYTGVRERYKQQLASNDMERSDMDPHKILEQKELQQLIVKTWEKLPERRRLIFAMHRGQGLKYKEIAEKLSVSVKTVEAEMTKSYTVLRELIEKYK